MLFEKFKASAKLTRMQPDFCLQMSEIRERMAHERSAPSHLLCSSAISGGILNKLMALATMGVAVGSATMVGVVVLPSEALAACTETAGVTTCGTGSYAATTNGSAYGSSSNANGSYATAMGFNSTANGPNSTAIGDYSSANGSSATALGDHSSATGIYATAIGYNTVASGAGSSAGATALGNGANATGAGATALGPGSKALGDSTAVGNAALATGTQSTAMGLNAHGDGNFATAYGGWSWAIGDNAASFGDTATATGEKATALGNLSLANGVQATAAGVGARATGAYATAIGAYSNAVGADSVALGQGSYANTVHTGAYTINGATTGIAGQPVEGSTRVVSVGTAGAERQIQNVAAGVVSATSTDAINGSQLYAVSSDLNGKINNVNGQIQALGYGLNNVQQQLYGVRGRAYEGTAVAMASVPMQLPEHKKFGVTAHFGNFQGRSALGGSAMLRVTDAVVVDGGIGVGLGKGSLGGRVGAGFFW